VAAQTQAECGASGYRVIASRWDAVLRRGWELRQDCAHPEWPDRLVAAVTPASIPVSGTGHPAAPVAATAILPLLVHAGDSVRLWEEDAMVRIEISGVAEQSARAGERVVVRITRQTDDAGLTVNRIGGIVRGAGEVEMER
jgi:hypothetical protein